MTIFAPMGTLAALTFAVLLLVPLQRVRAVRSGAMRVSDFALGEAPGGPRAMMLANRNYMNLLELPILFYVACLMFAVAARNDATALTLAWLYVALRGIHSAIHLTYNWVLHRLTAFALGNVVLAALWLWFFVGQ